MSSIEEVVRQFIYGLVGDPPNDVNSFALECDEDENVGRYYFKVRVLTDWVEMKS